MRAEDGQAVAAFDELHRRAPARIHLNRMRDAVPHDQVDAVDADEAERLAHTAGQTPGSVEDLIVFTGRGQDIAAVAISRDAEGGVAHELPREAHRHDAAATSNEHEGRRRALDELLNVVTARHAVAVSPRTAP